MHTEDKQVAGNLQLRLELTAVTILYTDTLVELAIKVIIQLGCNLEQDILQLIERRKCVVEDMLLERRFVDNGCENPLA